jgi:two-component system cell cycle sensor histidine kinase/response regulator CckA
VLRALVVDDIAENLYFLKALLSANNYDVATALNGAEALVLAAAAKPDLIITDLLMPVMDGFTLCRTCRAMPELADVLIVVYTATYTDARDETLALNEGADLFLIKPLEGQDLMKAIGDLVAKGASRLPRRPLLEQPESLLRQYNSALIRKLEDKLEELDLSRRRTRAFFEAASQGIVTLSPDGVIVAVNSRMEGMFGYDRAELAGRSLEMLLPERLREDHLQHLSMYFAQPGEATAVLRTELTGLRKDGSEFPLEIGLSFIRNDRGVEAIGLVSDISERRRQEEASRQLAAIVSSCQDAITGETLDGIVTSWNPGAERMLGYSAAEIVGTSINRLIPDDLRGQLDETLDRVRRAGSIDHFETELVARDGKRLVVSLSAAAIRDRDGRVTGISRIVRDVTEQRRFEDGLRQFQKMETIGQLAGGIAHDFNNLLTVINGYAGTVLGRLDGNDPLRQPVSQIQAAGRQAAALTRQLLAFSRRQILQARVVNINTIVRAMQEMFSPLIRADVHLRLVLDLALDCVKADPHQIEQMLLNLIINASDAMPASGVLTIETKNVRLGGDAGRLPGQPEPGRYVALVVHDTGVGMAPEIAARVFEPFFTTKPQGEGTGLGLSTVFGIVTQSGGHVTVDSCLGGGSSFSVFLPATDEVAPEIRPVADAPGAGGNQTILLVEDTDAVREFTAESLRELGYTVHEAAGAAGAIEIAVANRDAIDLVIADMVMPVMGGRDLVEKLMPLLGHRPVRVLFISGYAGGSSSVPVESRPGFGFLPKPYDLQQLADKVKDLLGETLSV